jgi:hypothetical protein
VKIQYISMDEHVADIPTKPLEKGKFVFFKEDLELFRIYSSLRGSVDVSGSIRHVFLHRSMCLDVWKSSKSFYS